MFQCLIALIVLVTALIGPTMAELELDGGHRWVGVFSTKDINEAIGVARLYSEQSSRVVLSKNGWFGVVLGPVEASDIAQFRQQYQGWPSLPSDALLSKGSSYVDTVWQPPKSPVLDSVEFSPSEGGSLELGDLAVSVAEIPTDSEESFVEIRGSAGSGDRFTLRTPSGSFADYGSSIIAVRLDISAQYPQFVVNRYSGGAHCCTSSWIFYLEDGNTWSILGAAAFDGEGFWFEDVDNDGTSELLIPDNSFYYAFDCYACSHAPLAIFRLEPPELLDVSNSVLFKDRFRQDIFGMEYLAKINAELWASNGFLAGWVASKARVGELDEAWDRMLPLYDRQPMFNVSLCPDGSEFGNCADSELRELPFPAGLARHLDTYGYGPLPARIAAYIPTWARPRPISATPTVPEPDRPVSVQPTTDGAAITVTSSSIGEEDYSLIWIEGELKPGDDKRFKQALLGAEGRIAVSFGSPGGDLHAGMEIGRAIWSNQLTTVVEERTCASACALAWLAGRPRYAANGARIGFHAPTRADDVTRQPDWVGSAIVGGYLADLGFTAAAIAYMTEPRPDDMRWLTSEQARRLGVYVENWNW